MHNLLSRLYCYPGDDYHQILSRCQELSRDIPEAAPLMRDLNDRLTPRGVEALEELYVQTFELSPACCLETGWHLFGERYERGEFMVYLRGLLREHEISESTELPDHLTHVLPLLGRMEPAEAGKLYTDFIGTALEKMLAAIQGKDNPYELLLRATQRLMEHHCAVQPEEALS
jgi:nitrate reductase molybdenum cofactor assembly chaperone